MSSSDTNMMEDSDSASHQQAHSLSENIRQIFERSLQDVFAVTAAIQNNTTRAARRSPASKEAIDAMPRVIVLEGGNECAICLIEIGIGYELREMPCKHGFHSGCIEQWLGIHGSCPICRFMMPTEGGHVEAGGSGS